MTDSYNSDDERYANDTFEQESDTDIPEMGEIESEISEASDDDDDNRLPSVKINTGPIKRDMHYTQFKTAANNTDAIPFDSSSDEEDDVVVGQTLAEINTPSMHFAEDQTNSSKTEYFESVDEQSESSVGEEDSDEEREFQRIKDMEERYLQQNSVKTPKTITQTTNVVPSYHHNDLSSDNADEQERVIKSNEAVMETKPFEGQENHESTHVRESSKIAPVADPIPELIEKVMEQFTPQPRVPSQIQNNFMEIVQNSLTSLIAGISANKSDTTTVPVSHSFAADHTLNPENVASALIKAMSASNTTVYSQNRLTNSSEKVSEVAADMRKKENESTKASSKNSFVGECEHFDDIKNAKEMSNGEEEVEVERIENTTPPPLPDNDDYDEESYSGTQFEYEITSKPPSCFNSDDYVFHANFIRPSPSTDKLRPRPHPRKSMSFSNERMREIERHNQILLRKILTQKPTYILRNTPSKPQSVKSNCQTGNNGRLTTSALNRKKQQRQIDLDNQVLKRKIEAIALRRRPLISS